jgi:NDP-sugar pyrophosphorylase family protein
MNPSVSTASPLVLHHAEGSPLELELKALSSQSDTFEVLNKATQEPLAHLQGRLPQGYKAELFSGKGGLSLVVHNEANALTYFALQDSQFSGEGFHWQLLPAATEESAAAPEESGLLAPVLPKTQAVTKQATILGAGIGSRILPLTNQHMLVGKPALPLPPNVSVIGRLATQLAAFGIERLFVNTFHHAPSVRAALDAATQAAGISWIEIPEERATGTAGGLFTLLTQPETYPDFNPNEPMLVLQGDAVTTANLADFLVAHQQAGASLSIGCQTVPDEDVPKFGIVSTVKAGQSNPSGSITGILEKPSLAQAGDNRFASTGFYALQPSLYPVLLSVYNKKLAAQQAKNPSVTEVDELDFSNDLFPVFLEMSLKGELPALHAHWVKGHWCDIGNPRHYYESLKLILEGYLTGYGETQAQDWLNPLEEGVLFWPETKAIHRAGLLKASGRVLVTLPFSGV